MTGFRSLSLAAVAIAALLSATAAAQDRASGSAGEPTVEVTPFVALGSPGSAPIGAAVSVPLTPQLAIETEVGYRRGEGHIHALSSNVSLLYYLPQVGRATPYLAAGAGLAEFGAPIIGPNGTPSATQSRVSVTMNTGGGVKVPVTDTWDMRTDVRWFKRFGRYSSEHWRVAHGISFDVKR